MEKVHLDLDDGSVVQAHHGDRRGQAPLQLLNADNVHFLNLPVAEDGVGIFFPVVVEMILDDVLSRFRRGDAPTAGEKGKKGESPKAALKNGADFHGSLVPPVLASMTSVTNWRTTRPVAPQIAFPCHS